MLHHLWISCILYIFLKRKSSFCGIRLGELLKLKSSDVHELNDRYYIEVVNGENESEDTRVDELVLRITKAKE